MQIVGQAIACNDPGLPRLYAGESGRQGVNGNMNGLITISAIIVLGILPGITALNAHAQTAPAEPFIMQVRSVIEERIAGPSGNHAFTCRGEPLCAVQLIPVFYLERGFMPIWLDSRGIQPSAYDLLQAIAQADQDGLQPLEYHRDIIEAMLSELDGRPFPQPADQADVWAAFDLLLTDAFLLLGSHMSRGRLNPENLHADWLIAEESIDLLSILQIAVSQERVQQELDKLRPDHEGYHLLLQARKQLQQLKEAGGYPLLPDGETLNPTAQSDRIPMLRRRLVVSGDLSSEQKPGDPKRYDDTLVSAVISFQKRHGLAPDGRIGRRTVAALNRSVEDRIHQIDVNLERWRWLQSELGERFIFINIADFKLEIFEGNRLIMQKRVVVGRPARRTPVFSSKMTYLVLNPYWNVPRKIAVEDILPKIIEDPAYLEKQGITVFSDWDEDARVIDPRSVDWSLYGRANFPFRLRQAPGPTNALGRIKFMFPNKFAVYLHDTPQRSLFRQLERDFSSGCIRVENVIDLADYLFKNDSHWSRKRLTQNLENGTHQVLVIPEPIAVHLVYLTAWMDETGTVQFRRDIYGRDEILTKALARRRALSQQRTQRGQDAASKNHKGHGGHRDIKNLFFPCELCALCAEVKSSSKTNLRNRQRNALPGTNRPGINVHEIGSGVVSDTAALKRNTEIAQLPGVDMRQADINGLAFSVKALACHTAGRAPKQFIGLGRSVPGNHVKRIF